MPSAHGVAIPRSVKDTHTVEEASLRLVIARGSNPIEGRLVDERGVEQAFYGWMELTSSLEAARSGVADGAEPAR